MNWYLTVIKEHYADFKGRARRKEFWMFMLINWVISMVLAIIGGLIHFTLLGSIYSLAVLVPTLGVGVRRLHDMGKSGWWYLIALVPIVGAIYLIYLWCQDSQAEANEWGANPKA
ncbi:DUF805 domain-containing protein [uncultured Alistipes sp.]|jgi:uncharacterized membrane protein YhaH (DUF805 family)|uniref:DUF805 domain-containing protein n=1 Tax=uncultured Alistipes sp. TaxID=538949 RepID=UPI0023C5E8CE|nr:DUF805 domain-containing protein [uncultured Alistipes sp.]MDE7005639.1 DUF805 domain-containing protein [Alistipes sp.]